MKPTFRRASAETAFTYTSDCPSFETSDLLKTHEKLDDIYHFEATFALEPDGILVKIHHDETVPKGAISWGRRKNDKTLFSCNPRSVRHRFLMVNTSAMLKLLHVELGRLGYTPELHDGLSQAAEELAAANDDPSRPAVTLTNSVIPPGLLVWLRVLSF